MDAGHPHVVLGRQRLMVAAEAMDEFGLVTGQTINPTIAVALIEFMMYLLAARLAIRKAATLPVDGEH